MGFWAEADNSMGFVEKNSVSPDASKLVKYRTPEYEKQKAEIADMYARRSRVQGPASVVASKAGYVAPSGVGAGMQAEAATKLDTASAGKGPSVAGAVMGQGADDALRARLSAMASRGPGANAALAGTQTGGAAAAAMQQAAAASAMAKAKEVQDASAQYAGLGGAMRANDFATMRGQNEVALANAGLAQSAALANQGNAIKWEAMSDAERNALLGMSMGLDQNEMRNRLNYYRMQSGMAIDASRSSMADRARQDAAWGQFVMGAGTAAGPMAQAYAGNQDKSWDDYHKDLTRK